MANDQGKSSASTSTQQSSEQGARRGTNALQDESMNNPRSSPGQARNDRNTSDRSNAKNKNGCNVTKKKSDAAPNVLTGWTPKR